MNTAASNIARHGFIIGKWTIIDKRMNECLSISTTQSIQVHSIVKRFAYKEHEIGPTHTIGIVSIGISAVHKYKHIYTKGIYDNFKIVGKIGNIGS